MKNCYECKIEVMRLKTSLCQRCYDKKRRPKKIKICQICKLDISFRKGASKYCIPCAKLRFKEYEKRRIRPENHNQYVSEYYKKWRKINRAKIIVQQSIRRKTQKYREKHRLDSREYRRKHPDRIRLTNKKMWEKNKAIYKKQRKMTIPVITFEIGGDIWLLPTTMKSRLTQTHEVKAGKLVYIADWYRIGWLIFAVGIVLERARHYSLIEEVEE